MKKFVADFETATWKDDETWVWAWATVEIGNEENLNIGNKIEDFLKYCENEHNSIFYFHNLKFDSEFIIYWLLTHGYKHVQNKKDIESNTFTTLISDLGEFYSVTIYFEKKNKKVRKVTFYDSLKIIPFRVEEIPKYFGFEISKLEIDYKKERERGHELTKEEEYYIKNDILIVAKALKILFDENLTKMTRASSALSDYKTTMKKSQFNRYFPILDFEVDEQIRKSYKRGFTYLNPIYKEKDVGKGVVLDVNSLYPSVLYNELMPIGEPIYYERKI